MRCWECHVCWTKLMWIRQILGRILQMSRKPMKPERPTRRLTCVSFKRVKTFGLWSTSNHHPIKEPMRLRKPLEEMSTFYLFIFIFCIEPKGGEHLYNLSRLNRKSNFENFLAHLSFPFKLTVSKTLQDMYMKKMGWTKFTHEMQTVCQECVFDWLFRWHYGSPSAAQVVWQKKWDLVNTYFLYRLVPNSSKRKNCPWKRSEPGLSQQPNSKVKCSVRHTVPKELRIGLWTWFLAYSLLLSILSKYNLLHLNCFICSSSSGNHQTWNLVELKRIEKVDQERVFNGMHHLSSRQMRLVVQFSTTPTLLRVLITWLRRQKCCPDNIRLCSASARPYKQIVMSWGQPGSFSLHRQRFRTSPHPTCHHQRTTQSPPASQSPPSMTGQPLPRSLCLPPTKQHQQRTRLIHASFLK